MTRRLLASSLALLAAPAFAQTADLDAFALDALTPSSRTVELLVDGEPGQSFGSVTETVTLEEGVLTYVSVANLPQAGGVRLDSTRMTWPGLVPLSDAFAAGGEVGSTTYTDGGVSGSFGAEGRALPFGFDLDAPRLAPAALTPLVQAIPFEEGFTVTLPTFSAKERFQESTLTVSGREEVEGRDGARVSAWVVEQRGGGGAAGRFPQTHYVDPQTRAILKTEIAAPGMRIVAVPMTEADLAARDRAVADAEAAEQAVRAAAPALRPGDAALALDAIQSEDVRLTIRLVQPQQMEAGAETRTIVVDEEAGTVTLTTDTNITLAGQRLQSTLVAAYPSFAPISMAQDDGSDQTELTFDGARVTGTEEGEPTDMTLDAPVFANAWMPVIVRTLPFAEGYSAVFHGYSAGDGVVETLLTVTGQEAVQTSAGERTAWVVEATRDGRTLTIRIDAETRALLSYGLTPQPGVIIEFVAD